VGPDCGGSRAVPAVGVLTPGEKKQLCGDSETGLLSCCPWQGQLLHARDRGGLVGAAAEACAW
jgi:hypothetical protein